MGGEAIYAGKPYPPIYAQALNLAGTLRGQRIDDTRVLRSAMRCAPMSRAPSAEG